jgi:alkylated DNA repair dioxygenase AlkB
MNHYNILPCDGEAFYLKKVFNSEDSYHYFDRLIRNISWKNDEVIIFGKRIITKRETAWYGDDGCEYVYSGISRRPMPWINELSELKMVAEKFSGISFNSCLLNLYHSGEEGMSWHSDDESSLGKDIVIASVSFGAERKFVFRHKKTKEKISIILENGSLLVMKGQTQFNWHHALPKSMKIKQPRINLTFRRIEI